MNKDKGGEKVDGIGPCPKCKSTHIAYTVFANVDPYCIDCGHKEPIETWNTPAPAEMPEEEKVCECPKDSGRHLGNFDGTILCNVCNLPKSDTPAPAEKVKLTEIELLALAEVDVEAFHQWKKGGKLPAGWKRTKYNDTPSPAERPQEGHTET